MDFGVRGGRGTDPPWAQKDECISVIEMFVALKGKEICKTFIVYLNFELFLRNTQFIFYKTEVQGCDNLCS